MNLFGVTAQGVLDRHLPRAPALGVASKPTLTAAGDLVNQVAGDLHARLNAKGVSSDSIILATYPGEYYWCQYTIDLGVLCKLSKAGLSQSVQEGVANACDEYLDRINELKSSPEDVLPGFFDETNSEFGSGATDPVIAADAEASSFEPHFHIDDEL